MDEWPSYDGVDGDGVAFTAIKVIVKCWWWCLNQNPEKEFKFEHLLFQFLRHETSLYDFTQN